LPCHFFSFVFFSVHSVFQQAAIPPEKIVITLPDGSQIEGEAGKTTPMDIAQKSAPHIIFFFFCFW
jgi:hypothetical protein